MEYRRKPDTVDAFQMNEDAEYMSPGWFMKAVQEDSILINEKLVDGVARVTGCTIYYGRGGKLNVNVGDYIVRESSGEIRPYKAEEFERKYERMG